MTDKEVMQQAMEALEDERYVSAHIVDAITALREALEQPEQVDCPRCGHVCSQRQWVGLTAADIDEIYEMGLGVRASIETALDKLEERNT